MFFESFVRKLFFVRVNVFKSKVLKHRNICLSVRLSLCLNVCVCFSMTIALLMHLQSRKRHACRQQSFIFLKMTKRVQPNININNQPTNRQTKKMQQKRIKMK